ncbi:hypothetical protein BX600DRAFT_447124 [Xylariales sp. PMI_506]|nr:hypothetical protein BX600DRAFT_447124 [Xylariales sp. PMI_506]
MAGYDWSYATAEDVPGMAELWLQALKERPEFGDVFSREEDARSWIRSIYEVSIDPPILPHHYEPWQERKVLVIRDNDGSILSTVVYFIVQPEDKGLLAWNKRLPPPRPEMGINETGIAHIYSAAEMKSAKYMGTESHIYVDLAITHPDHQRKGYMGKLLDVGSQLADDLDYPLFLVSSKAGKPGYLKKGYELLDLDDTANPYPMLKKKKSDRQTPN